MVEFNTDIWEKKYKFIGEASPIAKKERLQQ